MYCSLIEYQSVLHMCKFQKQATKLESLFTLYYSGLKDFFQSYLSPGQVVLALLPGWSTCLPCRWVGKYLYFRLSPGQVILNLPCPLCNFTCPRTCESLSPVIIYRTILQSQVFSHLISVKIYTNMWASAACLQILHGFKCPCEARPHNEKTRFHSAGG